MRPPDIIGNDGIRCVWIENALAENVQQLNGHALAVKSLGFVNPIYIGAITGRPAGLEDLTQEERAELLALGKLQSTPPSCFLQKRGYVGIYVLEENVPSELKL